ncbi:MAG: hypothetical protein A2Y59_06370 [Chloroflexi bacterium RBG_13_52_14]|nr:MAG: hypothetical protein A2Y59_06370 [Chloroflexi bacterium RBG_13_52_14]
MNYQADFVEGAILYSEVTPSRPNLKHLQGAMFLDRPDLWPSKRRPKAKPVPKEQQSLFE